MLRGMGRRKVCTHTAIPVCNELLEQRQGRDSNMSQMGAYLRGRKRSRGQTPDSQVERRATTSSPETLLWPSRTTDSCKRNQQQHLGEGIRSTCPAQINRNGGAPRCAG